MEVYHPTNLRKKIFPTKCCHIFKSSPIIIMGNGRGEEKGRNHHHHATHTGPIKQAGVTEEAVLI